MSDEPYDYEDDDEIPDDHVSDPIEEDDE